MQEQNIRNTNFNREECIETTFKEMGIRAEKKIAEHILKENIYDNNLISDISNVNYIKCNRGKTHLKEIEGFGIFVDDLYVYGYLREDDIVYDRTGGISCTTGNSGSATFVLEQIRTIVKYTIGKDNPLPMHINFMHTIELDKKKNGRILSTIQKIEKHSNVKNKWMQCNKEEKPKGAFVIKIDVSNVSLQSLQENLLILQTKLLTIGYAIYCVDYTQDYSGTMSREVLVNYLLEQPEFRLEKGDENFNATYTILDNIESVGRNVLTWIYEDEKTKELTYRVKIYNKIGCNFEAGEVRNSIGGHLADYVYSSNERLRRLFANKDVQERGISRIEVSVYGLHEDISNTIGENLIKNVLDIVTPLEPPETYEIYNPVERPLFFISPPKQQWRNLAEESTKCFILVDRHNHIIYLIWYGSVLTKRLAGIQIDYSKKKDKDNIEDYVEWVISDFGFKMVPIFRTDILSIENENIILSPLRCYVKNPDSYTILGPCRRALSIFTDAPDIEFYLPSTSFVKWEWRTKKEKPSESRKAKQELIEMPESTGNKKVSLLSVKQRAKIEEELREARLKGEWMYSSKNVLNKLMLHLPAQSTEHLKIIKNNVKDLEKLKKLKQKALEKIKKSLENKVTHKLSDVDPGTHKIVGWKNFLNRTGESKTIVVLEDPEEPEENSCFNIWPNTKICKIIEVFTNFFTSTENIVYNNALLNLTPNKKEIIYTYLPFLKNKYFNLTIFPKKSFYNKEGKKIDYFPVEVIDENKYKGLKEKLEKIEKESEEILEKYNTMFLENVPLPEDTEKYICRDIPEGSYKIQRTSILTFRGKPKIYLHLIALKNEEVDGEEKIVTGYYIEEEWKRLKNMLEGKKLTHPVICRLGMCKTNINKRKFRTCTIAYKEEDL